MPATRLGDIIIPEVFVPYMQERTAEKSALFQSGIIAQSAQLNELAAGGGNTVNMPFFKDLSGNSEVLSDTAALTVNPITTGRDIAVKHLRGKAWGANDLATALSGADPMGAIADLVAQWWARDFQRVLIQTLEGVFAASSMATTHVHNVTTGTATRYTCYLFGANSIGYGEGGVPVPVETDRDSLAGEDYLINRRHFIMHPGGVRWIGTAAGDAPTNAELATGTNWERVYEAKNVRIIKLMVNLTGSAANVMSAQNTIDAFAKLGDEIDSLSAIAMHSAVYYQLLKNDLITFTPVSQQGDPVRTYLGKQVIVDDACPVVTPSPTP